MINLRRKRKSELETEPSLTPGENDHKSECLVVNISPRSKKRVF